MLILVTVLLLTSSLTILAQVQPNYEIVAVAGSTPTIDGIINPEEWIDASDATFNKTTVFVKQDGVNLYIAFNISDNTESEYDDCGIAFDADHDENATLQTDDILLSIMRNGTIYELNVTMGTWYPCQCVSGWTAKANSTEKMWQSEFNISYSKLNITAGGDKTIGFLFGRLDWNIATSYLWPLPPANPESPNTWGNMTSNGYNWVPEFSNITYVIFFLASPLISLLIKRGKSRAHAIHVR